MHLRRALPLLVVACLAGCAGNPAAGYSSVAACVHDQFFSRISGNNGAGGGPLDPSRTDGSAIFTQAIKTCGDPVPDLTGDTFAQAVAIHYNVAFRVDLLQDTKLKNAADAQITPTGSLIPLPAMVFQKS